MRNWVFGLLVAAWAVPALAVDVDAAKLYARNCSSCHGVDRLGGVGPALLPENLSRLRKPAAIKTISEGRVATQMLGFGSRLTPTEITALADYIYTPPATEPRWDITEIRASHVQYVDDSSLPAKPVFTSDPENLFVVVESGDHHVTLLDGDSFEPIARFASRFALHGGPKFSPNGRFVYFASRDGWISKYDIWNLTMVAEVRAGINTRNLAVSGDGKYVMVANYLPHTLVLLDAKDLSLVRVFPVVGENGVSSRVSAVYQAEPRGSFVAALKDVPEVWEIPYGSDNGPQSEWNRTYDPANSYMKVDTRRFPVRRIRVDDYLDDFFFDPSYRHLIGTARDAKQGQVVDLDSGKVVASVPMPGMPHLGSGITWQWHDVPVVATTNLREGTVTVIDMKNWKIVTHIKTLGPGFFLRSHENTPYAWVDNMMSPEHHDTLQIIDKESLKVVRSLTPFPGRTLAHVEFTRDGRYALASLMEPDGALLVFDARTFELVKRIPMKRPVGKYNVYNKTTLSSGTSH